MGSPTQDRIRVLVVDDSMTIRETLRVLIDSQPDMQLVGHAASGKEGGRRAAELQPDVVLMDIHMPELDGIQATLLVSSYAPYGAVIMVTSEERLDFLQKAMAAGAQGYVLKPFGNGTQLFQTIRDVHRRSSARRSRVPGETPPGLAAPGRDGKRIVVVGSRGGVGATTVAVSLALLLRELGYPSVALVDADFQSGDTTLHLDLEPEHTILDLVQHVETLDAELIRQVMAKHRRGLHVLAKPPNPEQAEMVTADRVRSIVSELSNLYDAVVIDAPLSYDDRMLALLEGADLYLVVVTPHLGALRGARHFVHAAHTLGYPEDRITFILNRASDMAGLSLEAIASVLGTRSMLHIPSGGPELTQAVNEGRPLVLDQPRSKVSGRLKALAEQVRARLQLPAPPA